MPEAGGVQARRAATATRTKPQPVRGRRVALAARAGTRRDWGHAAARDGVPRERSPAGRASPPRSGRTRTPLSARHTCALATHALKTGLQDQYPVFDSIEPNTYHYEDCTVSVQCKSANAMTIINAPIPWANIRQVDWRPVGVMWMSRTRSTVRLYVRASIGLKFICGS